MCYQAVGSSVLGESNVIHRFSAVHKVAPLALALFKGQLYLPVPFLIARRCVSAQIAVCPGVSVLEENLCQAGPAVDGVQIGVLAGFLLTALPVTDRKR